MGEDGKSGILASWYRELQASNGGHSKGPLPHLGWDAGLATIIVGSYFAAQLADAVAIIAAYGPHAFFREGLRFADWKHGLLSNGAYLSVAGKLIQVSLTLLLIVATVAGADIAAMLLRRLDRSAPGIKNLLRVLGGASLLLFAGYLYRQHFSPIHPVPLSACLGGVVLIWKAIASAARRKASETQR